MQLFFKQYIYLLSISLLPLSFMGQQGTLKGKVLDREDGEFLVGVNIYNDNNVGTITDLNGYYTLNLPVGEQKITFKYIGYQKIIKEVFLKENETLNLDIELSDDINQLEVMVISANKYEEKLGNVPISIAIIKPTLIENKAQTQNVSEEQIANAMLSSVPAKRFGKAEEVANAIAFLCSPAASYINGVNVPVDGGRTGTL